MIHDTILFSLHKNLLYTHTHTQTHVHIHKYSISFSLVNFVDHRENEERL